MYIISCTIFYIITKFLECKYIIYNYNVIYYSINKQEALCKTLNVQGYLEVLEKFPASPDPDQTPAFSWDIELLR